jgi:hypothetical protein
MNNLGITFAANVVNHHVVLTSPQLQGLFVAAMREDLKEELSASLHVYADLVRELGMTDNVHVSTDVAPELIPAELHEFASSIEAAANLADVLKL